MTEEPNNFLANQARILAARAKRDEQLTPSKSIAIGTTPENERGRPTPQVPQVFNPSAPIKVERLDVASGTVTTREIPQDRPVPQRLAKPKAPTLDELRQELEEVGSNVDEAREGFQEDNASLDSYFCQDEQKQLRLEIAELQAALAEKSGRLQELTSKPLPRDKFYSSIKDAEGAVVRIARQLVEVLSEAAANKVFGVSLQKLSPASKRDVTLRYSHALGAYLDAGGSFSKLTRNVQATADVIDSRTEDLLAAVNDILDKDFLAES